MKELVVVSGKGGTGKTSVVGAFAALSDNKILADCDVDAADLHLILQPEIRTREEFRAGYEAFIDTSACTRCGFCLARCRYDAVRWQDFFGNIVYSIDSLACEGCGVCVDACPAKAIAFPERVCGEWFVSETRFGPMVHARLGIAAENSGKLVSVVRREAQRLASEKDGGLVIVDGPPGIGCPAIASITGASLVLAVAEPTVSGRHDFERFAELTRHFRAPLAVCVNKWDLNPEMAGDIEKTAAAFGATNVGRIRYDAAVTKAQVQGKTVVEFRGEGAEDIERVWKNIETILDSESS